MSNRQLGWDDRLVRDRVSPREEAEDDKADMEQQKAEQQPEDNADRVIDSNAQSHSKK